MFNTLRISLVVVLLLGSVALADWDLGDPHKMHFPQLPKVNGGWDVMSHYYVSLADDFKCSQDGYINDIHVWVSYKGDVLFDPTVIHLAICSDDPVGDDPNIPNYDEQTQPDGEDPDNTFSMPLNSLWHPDPDFVLSMQRWWADGPQGWFDPRDPDGTKVDPDPTTPDHWGVYQLNFLFDNSQALWQEKDTIYWLEFAVQAPNETQTTGRLGWKESEDHWNDDAVWLDADGNWNELWDPSGTYSMDLAFVITPEPATMGLLLLGCLAVIRRHK